MSSGATWRFAGFCDLADVAQLVVATILPVESTRASGAVPSPLMTVFVRLIACNGNRGGFMRVESEFNDIGLMVSAPIEALGSVQYAVEKGSIGM